MSAIISVEHIGKKYQLLHQKAAQPYATLREELTQTVRSLMNGVRHPLRARLQSLRDIREEFWALNDVSFAINEGERIGIIGRNGAGKSTLLKILSRITEPTTGSISMVGRVASLLEVGTGFHPELTGRENIYLNGAILGMKRTEIRRKFDEIVAFAEIEKFLDTPVKRYSSGMYVRLAFSVAAHLEPEILFVDEVLAVGDAQFQKKCLGKMSEISGAGRTLLFVSHNMASVTKLCQRAIWLDGGRIARTGRADDVVSAYIGHGAEEAGERQWAGAPPVASEIIRPRRVSIRNSSGIVSARVAMAQPFTIEIEYDVLKPFNGLRTGFWIYTHDGVLVFVAGDNEDVSWAGRKRPAGRYCSSCTIPGRLLNSGNYSLTIAADIQGSEMLFTLHHVLSFRIEHTDSTALDGVERSDGIICPSLAWTVTRIGDPEI